MRTAAGCAITNTKAIAHFRKSKSPTSWRWRRQTPIPGSVRSIARTSSPGRIIFKPLRDFGLFVNSDALPKLAWFEYLSGDAEQSVQLLGQAAAHQQGQAKALSLYYRGTILNRLGRYEQARTSLDEALAERPDLILARQEKGESLWQLGRKEEAISVWSDAVQRNARLVLANNQLAGALSVAG